MAQDLEYVVILHEAEEGGYWWEVPALPGAGSQGESTEETIANTRHSIQAVIEVMRERGDVIDPPKDIAGKVNVAA